MHRGITHSLLFGVASAILLPVIVQRIFRLRDLSFIKLFFFFCLQLCLHDLLDTCNAYGTGLLEPFYHKHFSFHLLYVGDPFFSISIVIAFIVLILLRKDNQVRRRWLYMGLIPASLYLFYAIFNKLLVTKQVEQSLSRRHIPYKNFIITPTPFNTFLWYIVAATDSGYVVGYRSVFDKDTTVTPFTYYPKNEQWLKAINKTVNVQHLIGFADGFYTVQSLGDTLVFNVLRFGQIYGWQDDSKVRLAFQYFLNPSYDNTFVMQRGRFKGWNRKTIIKMYQRIKGK